GDGGQGAMGALLQVVQERRLPGVDVLRAQGRELLLEFGSEDLGIEECDREQRERTDHVTPCPQGALRDPGFIVQRLWRRNPDEELPRHPGCAARPWALLCNAFSVRTGHHRTPTGFYIEAQGRRRRTLGLGQDTPSVPQRGSTIEPRLAG